MHLLWPLMFIIHGCFCLCSGLLEKQFLSPTHLHEAPFFFWHGWKWVSWSCMWSLDVCSGLLKDDSTELHLVFWRGYCFEHVGCTAVSLLGVADDLAFGAHSKPDSEGDRVASSVARVNLDTGSRPEAELGPIYKSNLLFFFGQWFISLLNWLDQLVFYFY